MLEIYEHWTKEELEKSKKRFQKCYIESPTDFRFLCGHAIQNKGDEDELDYYMIGAWLVQNGKYSDWSDTESYDLAEILEFMEFYHMEIPQEIKSSEFYLKKKDRLLSVLRGNIISD